MQPILLLAVPAAAPASFAQAFAAAGFVGPLMGVAGLAAVVMVIRRALELRPERLAPGPLQRELEARIHRGELAAGLERAEASQTLLGGLVAAGLYLRQAGLDEMLANVERSAAKESLGLGNRIANLARLGGIALLGGVFGTVIGLMSMLQVIQSLQEPRVADFAQGIGQALVSTALGLAVALLCYVAFFWLDARLARCTLAVRGIAEELLREAAEQGRAA